MDKIEKIRQEVERRKNICEGVFERESDTYYQGKAVAYGELLTFLDTLPEEPDKSLEEAAEKFARFYDNGTCGGIAQDCFIARAKWQAEQLLKSSPLPEDTVIFLKGIEEGKRLMMEEAVEGEVYLYHSYNRDATAILVDIPKDNLGDKVRLIVLSKED